MPFPFYDVSAPSPSTKNSITRTATDFGYRDFLLLKNSKLIEKNRSFSNN